MPIDFKKALSQIKKIECKADNTLFIKRLESTLKQFELAKSKNLELIQKLIETEEASKSNFTFAVPHLKSEENISTITPPEDNYNHPHIIIGTDGSQIYSSSHELTSASLINIGIACIAYFEKSIPAYLSSEPTIYNSLDEISPELDDKPLDEDLISYERTLKEAEELLKLSKTYLKHNIPVIALLDGTLIHWHLKRFNSSYIEYFIKRFAEILLEFKALRIPVASYISNSRSNDLINMLKISKCPYEEVDCKKYCNNIGAKELPCNPCNNYQSILDRKLIENLFTNNKIKQGVRTVLFKSTNKVLDLYPEELKIFFFYMFSGSEIARIEFPAFVAKDKNLLQLLHNTVSFQCKVGYGYPVVLSEAHLQAVVNKNDRLVFYDLLKEHMIQSSSAPIKISSKEFRKRVSFI